MPSIAASFLNDGSVTPRTHSIKVYNDSGGSLAAGDLVYISGWDEASKTFKVKKADADAGVYTAAAYVMRAAVANGKLGRGYKSYRLRGVNTNGSSEGARVYLSATAGSWTLTAPTTSDTRNQVVGRVAVVSASVGVIEFNLLDAGLQGTPPATLLVTTVGTAVTPGGSSRTIAAPEMGSPGVLILDVADAASGNADFTGLPFAILITGVRYVKTGGAGDAGNSMTLHNGTTGNAITGAMNAATDKELDTARSLDDAYWAVAANTTLRVVTVRAGGNNAARLHIDYVRTA